MLRPYDCWQCIYEMDIYVGPLIWEPGTGHTSCLDKSGPPWALVTLSTVPQEGELAIARAALQALADQPVRTLVTLAPGHVRSALGMLPGNARISAYVPHGRVLQRACLVVSHAGHGIVMKALYYGVPMVLVPWGRDQPGVAARAARLGVATVIPRDECSAARVTQAVSHVLTDSRYQETAERVAGRLQSEDIVGRASAYVEALLPGSLRKAHWEARRETGLDIPPTPLTWEDVYDTDYTVEQ
jgi:MGT family glycosyltransferase